MARTQDFKGRWALVTGASSGIGAALARELAGCGVRLILTARRLDRLEALADELRAQGAEVRVVAADLAAPGAAAAIFAATHGLAVEILVNNAGLGQYSAFHQCALKQELDQVRVNCAATVELTRLFLPAMVVRRRGWLLFLASTASFQPVPYLSTYAATKAFDRFFALGVAAEVARYGVQVTALCPGPTQSEFFSVAGSDRYSGRNRQTAAAVARCAVRALTRGQRTVVPYLSGRLGSWLVRLLPVGLVTAALERYGRKGLAG